MIAKGETGDDSISIYLVSKINLNRCLHFHLNFLYFLDLLLFFFCLENVFEGSCPVSISIEVIFILITLKLPLNLWSSLGKILFAIHLDIEGIIIKPRCFLSLFGRRNDLFYFQKCLIFISHTMSLRIAWNPIIPSSYQMSYFHKIL